MEICELPETAARYESLGATLTCGHADALGQTIQADYARWGEVISTAGITAN